jgi:DNA polymerase elongation subunit (family B)
MLEAIHQLLEQADAVVHYNGSSFDIPTLNREFLTHGLPPPAPYKQIDLLQVARKQFRFASNKLAHVAKELGFGGKDNQTSFTLWVRCMNGDQKAWKEMEAYNINDVQVLEKVYNRFMPWITSHPNHGLYDNGAEVCGNCGGHHLTRRGFAFTNALKYQRYQCSDCGTWQRSKKPVDLDKKAKYGNIV